MQSIIWDTSVYIINFRKGLCLENEENDCLIATSSTQINAKVITANLKDFELIRSYLNFEVSFITC